MADLLGIAKSLTAPMDTSTDYLGATVQSGLGGQPSPDIASSGGAVAAPAGVNEGGSAVETAGLASERGILDQPQAVASQSLLNAMGGGGIDSSDVGGSTGQVGDIGMNLSSIPSGTLTEIASMLGLQIPGGKLAEFGLNLAGLPTSLLTLISQFLPALAPAAGPIGIGITATNLGMQVAEAIADAIGQQTNAGFQQGTQMANAQGFDVGPGGDMGGNLSLALDAIANTAPGTSAPVPGAQAVPPGVASMYFDPVTQGYAYFNAPNPNNTGPNQFGDTSGAPTGSSAGNVGSGGGVGAGGDVEAP